MTEAQQYAALAAQATSLAMWAVGGFILVTVLCWYGLRRLG